MLLASLANQTASFNLVLIDSTKYFFSSAAEAYNEVLNNSSKYTKEKIGDILIFSHQDIYFENNKFLELIEKEFISKPTDILGFAGITNNGKVISNLKYMDKNAFITKSQLFSIREVESIDECLFACSKGLWEKIKFDTITCFDWHLYAVEFCYAARTKFKSKSYVLPYEAYHKANSEIGLQTDNNFLLTIWKLANKHKNYNIIFTPCYIVNTNKVILILKLFKTFIKNIKSKIF